MRLSYLIALLFLIVPHALADGLPELGEASQTTLSPLQERLLGESIMREIRADPSYLDDPPLAEYLNTLGYRLISSSDAPKTGLELFAIRDNEINAFSLPGGFIGVNTGLILLAQNESELASVLAHEIGHVTQHHIARILATQKWSLATSLAGIAVAILAARSNAQLSQAAMVGAQAAAVQNQLNFTREHEQEADRIGFQTLNSAGFDVRAMPAFFDHLQKATRFAEGSAPSYLRTHPLTFERIADMQNRVQSMHYRQVTDSQEFQFLRARLRAQEESPKDALAYFENSLQEKKYSNEASQHYGLGVLYIVLNNACWAAEWPPFTRSPELWAKRAEDYEFIDIDNPRFDFAKIADSLGVYGKRLTSLQEFDGTMEDALKHVRSGKPALLDLWMEKYTGSKSSSVP